MKVCTDACMLGAWFGQKKMKHTNILDIGTGTGLLMLMLAQKTTSGIEGIELEKACFERFKVFPV